MSNPHVPAAHMNTRLLVTGEGNKKKIWFGGGGDLTPTFKDIEVSKLFHKDLKINCDRYDNLYYPNFKNRPKCVRDGLGFNYNFCRTIKNFSSFAINNYILSTKISNWRRYFLK